MSTKQPFRALTRWRIDNILEINWRIAYALHVTPRLTLRGNGAVYACITAVVQHARPECPARENAQKERTTPGI